MNKKSLLMMMITICLIAVVGVGATLAYLTDTTAQLTNTFTLGNVDISLAEPSFDKDGTVEGIIPGQIIPKDPTVTVEAGSVESYIFMKVTGIDAMEALGDTEDDKTKGYTVEIDATNWKDMNPNDGLKDGVYVYKTTKANATLKGEALEPLFSQVVYNANNTEYVSGNKQIIVQAAAIQAMNGNEKFTEADALAQVDWTPKAN